MTKQPLHLIRVYDIMNKTYPGNKWLVQDLIPSEAITLISGAPASYKTFISIHLAQCVAEGKDFLGQFKIPERMNVLVLDKENTERDLKERFVNIGMNKDASILYASNLENFYLTDEKDVDELIQKVEEAPGTGLLIIDSLRRFHKGEENSSGDMSAIFDNLKKITSRGVTIVILHHHRKEPVGGYASANSVRGSSDIVAAVDCHIALEFVKKDALITFNQHKLRQAKAQDEFAAKVITDEESLSKVWFEFVGDYDRKREKNAEAINSVRAVFEVVGIDKELGVGEVKELVAGKHTEPSLRFALSTLVEDGFLQKSKGGHNRDLFHIATPGSVENPVGNY
jgi:KaiC/GvpD/RAD55 family RecA-like ATPase